MVSGTGKIFFSLSPFAPSRLSIWSRKTSSAVPSHVSPLFLHTQAESGAYSRDSFRFPRRWPHIPPTATGSVPSLSGHAIAYRWRSLPRVLRHGASSPQGSSSNGCCLFRYPHGPFFVRQPFFHTHYKLICSEHVGYIKYQRRCGECRTCLAIPNSQTRTETGGISACTANGLTG